MKQKIMRRLVSILLALPLLSACSPSSPLDDISSDITNPNAGEDSTVRPEVESYILALEDLSFDDFIEQSYQQLLLRKPETLTALGISGEFGLRDDQLNDLSDSFLRETQALESTIVEMLHRYDRDSMTADQQLNYDAYEWYLDTQVRGHPFMYHNYPLNPMIYSYNYNLLLLLEETHIIKNLEDAEDYITRLSHVKEQTEEVLEGLEIRKEMGIIPPDFVIDMAMGQIMNSLGINRISANAVDPENLSVYTTFVSRIEAVESFSEEDRASLKEEAIDAIRTSFAPAMISLLEHLEEIRPLAGSEPGIWHLPDGEAYYNYLIHRETSTDLTADEIHQIGLEEVERIQAEMVAAFEALGYPEDLGLGELRRQAMMDAGFFNGSTSSGQQQALDHYDTLFDRVEEKLPDFFDVSPQAEMIIIPESFLPTAFYSPGTIDGSRPGSFHVGLSGSSIPIYNIATTAYHEGFPGHHFQIALAQELDLPMFRAFEQYNGYAEGWALYAERLAYEMGMYDDDPYSNIGRLELELVRAVRLVVDTGIHAKGWSREETRQYMSDQIGDDSWSHEVERYAVMPGQALSYKVGMMEMLALRDQAASALGDEFNIIEFHHVLLTNGSLPLSILRQVVEDYIASHQ